MNRTEELLTSVLRRRVEAGTEARAKLAEAMEGWGLDQMWGLKNHFETLAVADLAERALDLADSKGFEAALEAEVRRTTEALLRGDFDASSTSQLSNAFDGVREVAARRHLEQCAGMLTCFNEDV